MRAATILVLAMLLAAGALAEPSYHVAIDEDFRSDFTVEQIVARAQEVVARPVQVRETETGTEVTVPPPPVVHAVYACRGDDLGKLDPRIGNVADEWIWVVVLTRNFYMIRHGIFRDTEGYILFHPVSGKSFGSGFFAGRMEKGL